MNRGRRRCLLAAPALWCAACAAPGPAEPTLLPLRLATSTPGGGFSQYGETLERVLNARSGRRVLEAVPSRGTTDNLAWLADGRVDAALIQGTSAAEALQAGTSGPLRILFAMYPSPGMLAVPASSGATRLEDLLGKPVVFGVRTSGLVTLGRQVFDGLGIDIDRDFRAVYVEQAAQSPRLVLSGQASGLWGAGDGWPGFTQLADSPGGARFLAPMPEQIPRIVARYPLLKPMTVAAGAYAGIAQPLSAVGSVNLILVRSDLDVARAAAFVDAMQASAAQLTTALPQAAFSTLDNTLSSTPSLDLLHPAVRLRAKTT